MSDETPKIIVDDDWKSQARAEKDKLAAQDAQSRSQTDPDDPEAGLPEHIGFREIVHLMATQALMYLGAYPDPQTGKAMIALDLAKLHIDMLGVLQDKTKGNLTPEEKSILDGATHELRMQFTEIVKALEQAAAEGRLGPGAAGGTPPGFSGKGPLSR